MFKHIVSGAGSIYSYKTGLDRYFAEVSGAKFSGNDDEVADIQEKLRMHREISDSQNALGYKYQ